MKNKIKTYIKDKIKTFKKLNKKLEDKNKTIQEQADTINFLIQEMNTYKEKCVEVERELKEEKTKNKFLIKRENKLQEVEQLFNKKEVNLSKLSRIIKDTRSSKQNIG